MIKAKILSTKDVERIVKTLVKKETSYLINVLDELRIRLNELDRITILFNALIKQNGGKNDKGRRT